MQKLTVLLGDPRLPDRSKPGHQFTADDRYQVERLQQALSTISEYQFDYLDDHLALVSRLAAHPPEFVVNFCDTGFGNDARQELHLPALLELLGVPYSGTGPVGLGICYDKALVRAVAAAAQVPVPSEILLRGADPVPELAYPAFIKPNRGDGSVGITVDSIVHDPAQAHEYVARLRRELPDTDILVQEFLTGDEYGLGVIGNPQTGFVFLPPMRVDYSGLPTGLPRLLDYSSKVDPNSPYWTELRYVQASLELTQLAAMQDTVRTLFARLQLRDYARFDFRADRHGVIKLMEVNPNPAWCWDGKLAYMGQFAGLDHAGVLRHIIEAALSRYAAAA